MAERAEASDTRRDPKDLVYFLPIGATHDTLTDASLEDLVQHFLGARGSWLPPEPVPAGAYVEARGQVDSTALMHRALERIPADGLRILALTEVDIMIPTLTFLYGRAQLDGHVALVSLARLKQEFYGRAPDNRILADRVRKEALHELGHTFGLTHCTDRSCVMAHSVGILDIDRKHLGLCTNCDEWRRASVAVRVEG